MRVNASSMVEAVLEQPIPPCEPCTHFKHCAHYEMACEQFAVYMFAVKQGDRVLEEICKVPTRALYNCLFPADHSYHGNSRTMRRALNLKITFNPRGNLCAGHHCFIHSHPWAPFGFLQARQSQVFATAYTPADRKHHPLWRKCHP